MSFNFLPCLVQSADLAQCRPGTVNVAFCIELQVGIVCCSRPGSHPLPLSRHLLRQLSFKWAWAWPPAHAAQAKQQVQAGFFNACNFMSSFS
mmetsp:Transcript_8553/g.16166  ORF Transcript_8553/g.16166 Transcript_8553/m.16166 type:complete len:92 (+) Transcript_8553:29-304(+)